MAEQLVDDVSQLNIEDNGDSIDWAKDYELAGERKPYPAPGTRVRLRMPEQIKFSRGSKGQLMVSLEPLVIAEPGQPYDGAQVRFVKVSTRKFPNSNASQAADVLRNFGSAAQPTSPADWQNAFRALAGQTTPHGVELTWRGYDKTEQKEYKAEEFPLGQNGERQTVIEIQDAGQPDGVRRVYANLTPTVRGFSPLKGK